MKIGLLEDDGVIAEMLTQAFVLEGWSCSRFGTLAEIEAALEAEDFDALVLDWLLPDGTADTLIRKVRARPGRDIPILIESLKDDEALIVRALELGADDYVVKPLRLSEVNARIRALLRRKQPEAPPLQEIGPYRIDLAKGEISVDGMPVELTRTEFELASFLFRHAGELLTRDRLLTDVWGTVPDLETRTVDTHVSRLRKKLELGPSKGVQLSTLHGYGYRLEIEEAA